MENNNMTEEYKLEGEKLNIVKFPAPVLKKKAAEITEFTPELRELVKNMIFTMYHAPGIGLAAPQIGKSIRLFVIDTEYERELVTHPDGTEEHVLSNLNPKVYINPVFKEKEGEILYEEGCLSVPGIYEEVKRADKVVVEYQDLDGNKQTVEAEETLAVCLQHENDHLDGIVFIDRLSMLKRNFITKKLTKKKKK